MQEGGDVEKGKGDLIAKEDQEIGQIGYKVYWWALHLLFQRSVPLKLLHLASEQPPSVSPCQHLRCLCIRYYMKAYGLPSCGLLVFCWSSEQAVRVLTNWWLSQW
jgi:hypothetical protein